jgi:hypothetical protein
MNSVKAQTLAIKAQTKALKQNRLDLIEELEAIDKKAKR